MPTFLRLGFVLVSVIPAALATLIHYSPASGALVPRQAACPAPYQVCSSNVGGAICGAPGEYCCQILGAGPFLCPGTHPYCCPGALCGSDSKCSGPIIDAPTQTIGASATATATTAVASGSTSAQTPTQLGTQATVTQIATATPVIGGGKTGGASSVAMGAAHNFALIIVAAVGLLAWL